MLDETIAQKLHNLVLLNEKMVYKLVHIHVYSLTILNSKCQVGPGKCQFLRKDERCESSLAISNIIYLWSTPNEITVYIAIGNVSAVPRKNTVLCSFH